MSGAREVPSVSTRVLVPLDGSHEDARGAPGAARPPRRAFGKGALSSLAAGLLVLSGCGAERPGDAARPGAEGAPSTAARAPRAMASEGAPPVGGAARPGETDSLPDPQRVPPAARPRADMRLEVDLQARQLHVYRGQRRSASYPVGVGTREWPTRTGEWVVSQVVWNPEWVPPAQSWADEREPKKPGERDNPLGRAQLIYDPPRTVHGTNKPESVGKASSHGSIRMRDADIVRLAREVQEMGGEGKDDAWHRRVQEDRTTKEIVDLPRVVPIRVR